QCRRYQQTVGPVFHQGAQDMRHQQADKADAAGHRHGGADQHGGAQYQHDAAVAVVEAHAAGDLITQTEAAEQTPLAEDQSAADQQGGQQQPKVFQSPFRYRPEQPEHQFLHGVGVGREVEYRGQGGAAD